jgi:hypothetical protein
MRDDPIAAAVISNRLSAITQEMGQIILLTSRSSIEHGVVPQSRMERSARSPGDSKRAFGQ